MVYPQWSRGFKVTELNSEENSDKDREGFEYPFTQVPTSSPLIRIRLGDVLKSNYTKRLSKCTNFVLTQSGAVFAKSRHSRIILLKENPATEDSRKTVTVSCITFNCRPFLIICIFVPRHSSGWSPRPTKCLIWVTSLKHCLLVPRLNAFLQASLDWL